MNEITNPIFEYQAFNNGTVSCTCTGETGKPVTLIFNYLEPVEDFVGTAQNVLEVFEMLMHEGFEATETILNAMAESFEMQDSDLEKFLDGN